MNGRPGEAGEFLVFAGQPSGLTQPVRLPASVPLFAVPPELAADLGERGLVNRLASYRRRPQDPLDEMRHR